MPSYDYRCQTCNSFVTLERSMTDNSTPVCSGCGSQDMNRIWNVVAISSGSKAEPGHFKKSPSRGGCGSCSGGSCGSCHH
jgi:putative FmdB family regulatory protein